MDVKRKAEVIASATANKRQCLPGECQSLAKATPAVEARSGHAVQILRSIKVRFMMCAVARQLPGSKDGAMPPCLRDVLAL